MPRVLNSLERAQEIARVTKLPETTSSPYLRRDMEKYLRRLQREARREQYRLPTNF